MKDKVQRTGCYENKVEERFEYWLVEEDNKTLISFLPKNLAGDDYKKLWLDYVEINVEKLKEFVNGEKKK